MARIEFSPEELGDEGFGGDYMGPIERVKGVNVDDWTAADFEKNIQEVRDIYRYGMDQDSYNAKLYRARQLEEYAPKMSREDLKDLGYNVTDAEYKKFKQAAADRALMEELKRQYGGQVTEAEFQRYKEQKALEAARRMNGAFMTDKEFNDFKAMYGK